MHRLNAQGPALLRLGFAALALQMALGAPAGAAPGAAPSSSADLKGARLLFEKNLDAIKRRDREGYLACYLHADTLARTGLQGPLLGYEAFVKESGDDWPDLRDANCNDFRDSSQGSLGTVPLVPHR